MEAYFSGEDDVTSDYLVEGLLRSIINSAKVAVKDPNNYEARSNLMWSSTLAMNPIMGLSKTQDWEVHMIEHQLGAYTDCAHGMRLARQRKKLLLKVLMPWKVLLKNAV